MSNPQSPLQTSHADESETIATEPPAQEDPDEPTQSSTDTRSAPRRGRFRCQKRKIRCSGHQPCQHCQNGTECKYPEKGRRPRTAGNAAVASDSSEGSATARTGSCPQGIDLTNNSTAEGGATEDRLETINSRLGRLERNVVSLSEQNTWTDQLFIPTPTSFSLPSIAGLEDPTQPFLVPGTLNHGRPIDLTQGWAIAGSLDSGRIPSFAKSIDAMDESGRSGTNIASTPHETCNRYHFGRCAYAEDSVFSPCCERDMTLWTPQTCAAEVESLRRHFRSFFDGPNTHYPCINEPFFHSWFETLVSAGPHLPRNPESIQFIALIHFMKAVIKILGENAPQSQAYPPGSTDFGQAEHLLGHALWSGNTSLLTIQCLIVKASYLLYIEKPYLAYDAVGTANRVMYQIGLHNQKQWKHHSKFETVMSQRTFWSLYCLDRAISLASGAPCIIQNSTIHIDMPPPLDDRQLLPGASLPAESPTTSSVPYLQEMVNWARLYSETCKTMSDSMGDLPLSAESIARLDDKVVRWLKGLPPHLTWSPELLILEQSKNIPHFILRHSVILLLRGNYLRLLIRQEDVMHREYKSDAAAVCIGIASHSIDVVDLIHSSFLHRPLERYSSVTFLAGAIIPLICVLLKENSASKLFAMAVDPFRRALGIMHTIASGFAYARRTLARLRSKIILACRKIETQSLSHNILQPSDNAMNAAPVTHSIGETGFGRQGDSYPLALDEMLLPHITGEGFTMEDPAVTSVLQ